MQRKKRMSEGFTYRVEIYIHEYVFKDDKVMICLIIPQVPGKYYRMIPDGPKRKLRLLHM